MKPTRILPMLVRLAATIVPFAVSSCYVTPPSVSFYPPPPPRPVGITDRTSPNFYVLHQHRLASPPRGYVGDPGSGGGSNGGDQNGVSAGNSGNGGDSGSGGGWSGDPNNGNVGSGGGWNGGNSNGNGGDQNGVSGGNSNGDPYGNGSGGSIGSGPPPPPAPPAAPNQVTCAQGYVWREASSTDFVCVTPNARAQAAYDNSQASARSAGGGDYGADTCVQGYVWREAFAGDHVCVTPQTRSQTASDNSLGDSRQSGSSSSMSNYNRKYIPHNLP